MKTKLFILTICIAILCLGATAKIKDGKTMTGSSLTDFGRYTVINSDVPMVHNNQALKTYELRYENTNNPIIIGLVKEKDCTTFIVRSDEFEIEYTCNKGVFGVKKIESKYQELPKEEMALKLNKVSYYSQRVICQNKKSEDELLGLIACYFPNLINEEYQAGL
ncbi:MAG: hypothetical protein HQ522_13385 [Bacteroidetes bacterium]|nr:hypothetical protein [Bacteroidota bacterium]